MLAIGTVLVRVEKNLLRTNIDILVRCLLLRREIASLLPKCKFLGYDLSIIFSCFQICTIVSFPRPSRAFILQNANVTMNSFLLHKFIW